MTLPAARCCRTWLAIRLATPMVVSLLLVAAPGFASHREESAESARELAPRHRDFLASVELLISDTERSVFLALSEDYRRDAFVRRFWRERDPFPETAKNEFHDQYERNLAKVKARFPDLRDGRAEFMLIHGPPATTFRTSCQLLQSLEIWQYRASDVLRHEFAAIFLRRGGRYDLWSAEEGLHRILLVSSALDQETAVEEIANRCPRGGEILSALTLSPDWRRLEAEDRLRPRGSSEWAQSFLASSTEVPQGSASLDATLEVAYTGRHQSRTIVQALLELESESLGSPEGPDETAAGGLHLLLDGEIVREGELFDTFRYKFDLPTPRSEATTVPVLIERYLRPGVYRMVLRLQDLQTDRYFKVSQDLDVPRISGRRTTAATPPSGAKTATTEPAATAATSQREVAPTTLRLKVPGNELATGRVRIVAVAAGGGVRDIARVRFELNDRALLSKARPPYAIDLEVGRAPRTHTVRAIALSKAGEEIARDEVLLNGGPNRFSVRLIEPKSGHDYRERVRAAAEVEIPQREKLERVEFYLNQEKVATLFQEPFVQPIQIPSDLALAYVRAVAVLENGGAVEDVVFVNAPDIVASIDVDFVELYTTVLDRRGRLAENLSSGDFTVIENGVPQTIRRFEPVRDLPIHAGVLIDVSMSMLDRLEEAEEAALHFFELVLTPQDRASLMTFSDRHQLVVPFANSTEVLAGGLAGLVAEGETALYDSLIHALYSFNGIPGKRAIILLSDGEDSRSEYRFDEVLEYARHSGVAIYSIGLDIALRDVDIRNKLSRLCDETGGRCFFIESASELKSVYTKIEQELRSQYLIAYQSTAADDDDSFREIKVKVRQGLKARTLRGYYP